MGQSPQNWIRYKVREDGTGRWAVYDVFTGLTVEVNDIPLDDLDEALALDMMGLLNSDYTARHNGMTH